MNDRTDPSGRDAFLARFEADGTRTWVQQFGSDKDEAVGDLAVDAQGHIFIAGSTVGGLGSGRKKSKGKSDAFLARLCEPEAATW